MTTALKAKLEVKLKLNLVLRLDFMETRSTAPVERFPFWAVLQLTAA